jgi:hypothetical protein
MATLAKSIVKLREQINARYPNRSKISDGTWPSAAHRRQSPNSDHNNGNAIDFTHDPKNGFSSEKLADHLRVSRDPRLKYVISNRKIASGKTGWKWTRYSGSNAHDKHVHISVNRGPDSDKAWSLPPIIAPGQRMGIANLEPATSPPDPAFLPEQPTDEGVEEIPDEMTPDEGQDDEEGESRQP